MTAEPARGRNAADDLVNIVSEGLSYAQEDERGRHPG